MPSLPKVYPGKHLRFNTGALENEGEIEEDTPSVSLTAHPLQTEPFSFIWMFTLEMIFQEGGSTANRNIQIPL